MDYKVTNESGSDIYLSWNLDLLSDENLAKWEEYKKTDDYLGRGIEDQNARLFMPEQLKLLEWVNDIGLGFRHFHWQQDQKGRQIKHTEFKLRFPKGESLTFNERQVRNFRNLEKTEIEQAIDDPTLKGKNKDKTFYRGFYIIEAVDPVKVESDTIGTLRRKASEYGLPFTPSTKKVELEAMVKDYEGR